MQQALENPHYKKIWEKVIMNRHPEAKSLEQALVMETKERYCQYILTDNDNCIVDGDYISKYYHHNNNYEILGKPITLEDILMLFPFYAIHAFNTSQEITIKVHYKNGIDECYIKYQLTKPLHEQTPKTWEKIANLINCI